MSKELLSLEISGLPPTLNHLYRSTKSGRRYKTEAGKEYQHIVSSAMREEWGMREAYTGAVELRLTLYTDDRRRWDIDNRVKAIQDCLSLAGVIEDDRQVRVLHVERLEGEQPKTRLLLQEDDR